MFDDPSSNLATFARKIGAQLGNWTQEFQIGPGLARGGFGIKNVGWENTVLWRNGFENGDGGVSRDQNGLYGTPEAFGKASFPPNPFKKWFPSTCPNFGKFGEGPTGPLCISYGPFVGSYPYPTPDQPPEVAAISWESALQPWRPWRSIH